MQKKIKYENDIHWPVCLAAQGKNGDIQWISRISHQGQRNAAQSRLRESHRKYGLLTLSLHLIHFLNDFANTIIW